MSATKGSGETKIASLDGFRAAAIVIVFLSHALPDSTRFPIPGGFGVTTFFFLSGYLITTLLRREYDAAGTINFGGFYLRRLLRIYPPMLSALALLFVFSQAHLIATQFAPVANLLVPLLQVGNYFILAYGPDAMGEGAGVLWSLAVEEHFYLFFPLLYFALRRRIRSRLRQALVLWGICVVVLGWRLVYTFVLHGPGELRAVTDHMRLATDTRLDSIFFGSALAVYGNPALDPIRISKPIWTWILLPVGLCGFFAAHFIPGAALRECFKYSLEGLSFIPVFIAAIRYPTWGPLRVLNWRPVAFCGVLSYSFYLVHAMILRALERLFPRGDARLLLVGFGAALLIAWVMHVAVEKPSNQLRRRLRAARPASGPRAPANELPEPTIEMLSAGSPRS